MISSKLSSECTNASYLTVKIHSPIPFKISNSNYLHKHFYSFCSIDPVHCCSSPVAVLVVIVLVVLVLIVVLFVVEIILARQM